jgi:TonB-linked SusC/RagA family outer membrane protein
MRRSTSALARAMLLGVAALFGAAGTVAAQASGTIRGTVSDSATRQPIPGVSVVVVGSTRGALTDAAGRYIIRAVPSGSASVRAQRIGFAPREVQVVVSPTGEVTADFLMRPQAAVLSEVVVVGYGTRSRAEVSSAVAQVKAEEVQNVPLAGIDAALQGKAPGVQVIQNAGNPGNGITVRVRGASSISASNHPLYVIDGVPMIREDMSQLGFGGQDITAVTGISPDEIESIDVLKDAAAASIYGSRASNGVVMITTKRGRPGATKFGFSTYFGQQKALRNLDLLNAQEYVEYMAEAVANDGYTNDDVIDYYGNGTSWIPGVDDRINQDWQKAMQRTAPVHDISLSASGGGDRFQYMLSGSNFSQTGVILGSDYKRQNARLNLDVTATPKLQFRSSMGISRERWNRIVADNTIEGAANMLAVQPNIPVRRADGNFTSSADGLAYTNPVALVEFNKGPTTSFRFLGNIETSYDFTERLRWNVRVGTDVYNLLERYWASPRVEGSIGAGSAGDAEQGSNHVTKYIAETYGTYDPFRNERQKLTLTAGASAEYNRFELIYLEGQGFGSDAFQYPGSASKIVQYDARPSENNLVSLFSRANYSLHDRYFVTASLRTDGSSRFGENSRFGVFPSASVGWQLSEEPSLSGIKRFMDAKVRASYGVTGNQSIPTNFGFLTTFARANYAGTQGISPSTIGNPDLKWETTKEFDFGVDLGFLDGRLSVIADYYRKVTDDLLVQRPVPSTSGFTSVWDNVGSVSNRGFEFQVSTENVRSANVNGFSWRTDFNISHNKNRVESLYCSQAPPPAPKCEGEPFMTGSIRAVSRIEVGQPLGAFYTLKFDGVDPETGDAIYADPPEGETEARRIVGSPHPDYFGGLRNQISFMGFDLNTFFDFSQGQEVFNLMRLYSNDGGLNADNKMRHALRRWQKPGDVTDEPRASWDGTSGAYLLSDRFVEDGSYVRLSEVTLGYRLPNSIASRARLSDARLYVSGRNLKLWTDYSGIDPDVNSEGSSSNTALGIDFYPYPRARTISIGISGNW